MDIFKLSDITGCTSPITGITTGYDVAYNKDAIVSYHKVDKIINFVDTYIVSITFNNSHTLFKFIDKGDRDTFYNSL